MSQPYYGVRVPAKAKLSFAQRCSARATRLSGKAAFSHLTAARLHGLPLPAEHERADIFEITVPRGQRAPRGNAVRGHQAQLGPKDVDKRTGVHATTPERTFCDLAACLTLGQLVAVGDTLIRRHGGLLTRKDLERNVASYRGRRNIRRLRRALELLDQDAESPKESELRVAIIEAGFPTPTCNESVFDGRGRLVGRVDLAYPALKIAIEYEGDYHRQQDQWRADLKRRRRLEALGWTYLSVTQADLDGPEDFLADLRVAMER
ncbi:type IV toxin-antitoxin system AbiEi family antitoxin [Microbacterium deminutum]|uniref:AbiEi antitoxin C-terminal domain-containing protein n=1 Tax=Microbacterium deminutum TaxID=344164 RepID=A0ABP5C7N9_9MICO